LKRLGFSDRITAYIEPEISLPAIGQGAIGIECRVDDARINELLEPLHHPDTATCVAAERALNQRLQGGCQVPIGGHAVLQADQLWLRGLVGTFNGSEIIRAGASGSAAQAESLGVQVAESLLERGAGRILDALYASA
jgi:hydroxymethylbilane synthase